MNKIAKAKAGIISTMFAAGLVTAGISLAPAAMAAEGCAQGYHLDGASCVVNIPGPGAVFNLPNPGCWHNDLGEVRCFPGAVA